MKANEPETYIYNVHQYAYRKLNSPRNISLYFCVILVQKDKISINSIICLFVHINNAHTQWQITFIV